MVFHGAAGIPRHPPDVFRLCAAFLLSTSPLMAAPDTPAEIASEILVTLLDPAKVATLKGDRPANTRLYKVLYWLLGICFLLEAAERAIGSDRRVGKKGGV